MAISQQHDLEYDTRIFGTGSDFAVLELDIQGLEVEFVFVFVFDQVVQCEGKAAGTICLDKTKGSSGLLCSWCL